MGTSASQDKEFLSDVVGDSLLENAIEWIARHMSPEDVFPDSALEYWAETNGYVKE